MFAFFIVYSPFAIVMFVNMSAAALVAVIVTPSSCVPDVFVTVPVMFPF